MRLANAFCSTASLDEWRIIERRREYKRIYMSWQFKLGCI